MKLFFVGFALASFVSLVQCQTDGCTTTPRFKCQFGLPITKTNCPDQCNWCPSLPKRLRCSTVDRSCIVEGNHIESGYTDKTSCEGAGFVWCGGDDIQHCVRPEPVLSLCWKGNDVDPCDTAHTTEDACNSDLSCFWCSQGRSKRIGKCWKLPGNVVPSGPGTVDNCLSDTRRAKSCKADGNEALCLEKGCHWCPDPDKPDCIEGWACLLTPDASNVCTAYSGEILTPAECLARNCSWCDHNKVGYKCIIEPTEPVDTGAPPASPVDQCSQTTRVGCPARNNVNKCWSLGCHYCQKQGVKNCIEGLACKIPEADLTAAHDCRDNSSHVIQPRECLDRGCSYCKSNDNIKCVREVLEECTGPLMCYPFPDDSITESQCESSEGCEFCPDTDIRCRRVECPDGTELRYDEKSCCNSTGEPRIVGGTNAAIQQWPWMAYMFITNGAGGFSCAAFLVDTLHVVSAAHCYEGSSYTYELRFGSANINTASVTRTVDPSFIHVHPDYNTDTFDNDIMILKLSSPITTGSTIAPVALPNGEEPPVGMTCYVAGWGATSVGGVGSNILLETFVHIQADSDCAIYGDYNSTIHVCAGLDAGGQDSCQGDSGGPLVCQRCRSCEWYVTGIVSYGRECALPNTPGVYAKVSAFSGFLTDNGVTVGPSEYDCNLY